MKLIDLIGIILALGIIVELLFLYYIISLDEEEELKIAS